MSCVIPAIHHTETRLCVEVGLAGCWDVRLDLKGRMTSTSVSFWVA